MNARSPLAGPSSALATSTPARALAALAVSAALGAAACGPAPAPPPPPAPAATVVVTVPPPPAPTATAVAVEEPACTEPEGPRPAVLNLATAAPPQDWLGWQGDTSAPVDKACKKLEKRRANLLKKLKDDAGHVDHIGRCLPSPKGAWVLDTSGDVQPLKVDADHPEPGWEVRFTLAYVTPEGKLVRSKRFVQSVWKRGIQANDWRVIGAFDYDGDGVSEIALLHDHHYGDEDRTETRFVHTWKDGEAVLYAPAAFPFVGMLDVDADKRPDLLVSGPFAIEGPCGLDGHIYRGPRQVAHSLPDGKFATDDAVAKEVVRAQCGPAPKELAVTTAQQGDDPARLDDDATVLRITCARIYGTTADEAVRRVREDYPFLHEADGSKPKAPVDPCLSLEELVKLAGQEPPFTMAAPCPPK